MKKHAAQVDEYLMRKTQCYVSPILGLGLSLEQLISRASHIKCKGSYGAKDRDGDAPEFACWPTSTKSVERSLQTSLPVIG